MDRSRFLAGLIGPTFVVVALGPGDVAPPPSPDELRLDLIAADAGSTTSSLRALARHPRRAAHFAAELRRMRPERPPFRRALPHVAGVLERAGVTWVHAHFAWEASGVAQALASLLGCGWSLTAHANDIFVRNSHLARKLRQVPHLVTVCRYNVDELARAHGTLPDHHAVVCGVRVEAVEDPLAGSVQAAVGPTRAHVVEEARHPADRGSVGAPVVVDDDDEAPGVVVADVVERLPRHPPGERAVADDGDHVAITLPGHRERA